MASIRSQMTLNDGMSAVLKKITSALDLTLASFEQIQRASGQAMDTADIEAARGALAEANDEIEQMAENYRQAAQQEERLNESIGRGTDAAGDMLKKVASLVAAYTSLSAIKNFAVSSMEAANTQINAQLQLKTVTANMGTGDYYDQIVEKAGEIQGDGIYGDEIMIAGAAELATYFEDGQAVLSMMDTLSNYAMGMSSGGELDSSSMVDYATGIGKIMTGSYDAMTKKGFEFTETQKAIIEGTATEQQVVAALGEEYLTMSNDMRAAAVIGAVIDESWAGMYETMSNTPQGKLIQLNNTLGDIKETIGIGIYPAVLNFVNVIQQHLPQIEKLADDFASGLSMVLNVLTGIVDKALDFAELVTDNWSWIAPVIMGIVTALGLFKAAMIICTVAEGIATAAKTAFNIVTGLQAAATEGATAAQWGLNAAMYANPIGLIILLIVALIVIMLLLWENCEGFRHFLVDTYAEIAKRMAQFYNDSLVPFANGFIDLSNTVIDAVYNFSSFVINATADMAVSFAEKFETMWDTVKNFAKCYNAVAGVIGTKQIDIDYDFSPVEYIENARNAALQSLDQWKTLATNEHWEQVDLDAFNEQVDAWAENARDFSVVEWLKEKLAGAKGELEDFLASPSVPGMGEEDCLGEIADNVAACAGALSVSEEELKYLRDIAERDAVNRFTTAEVKIDMSGMTNRIDSSMDLDGIVRELTDGFSEALLTAAEGVHE